MEGRTVDAQRLSVGTVKVDRHSLHHYCWLKQNNQLSAVTTRITADLLTQKVHLISYCFIFIYLWAAVQQLLSMFLMDKKWFYMGVITKTELLLLTNIVTVRWKINSLLCVNGISLYYLIICLKNILLPKYWMWQSYISRNYTWGCICVENSRKFAEL